MSEPIIHAFDLERKRNQAGITTAFALGYYYAKAAFSAENPPQTIHLEGRHSNGKSAFAKGMAAALTQQQSPETVHELSGHFNWRSGATEQNVTIIDASKLKHPDSGQVFNTVDHFILPEKQVLVIEHASLMEDDLFAPDSPAKNRAMNPDVRIGIGDLDDTTNRQLVTIEIMNPDSLNQDGFRQFEDQFLPRMPWCAPASPAQG